MLEFYEFNTLNITIVLISTFIIYYILSKWFSNNKKDESGKDENGKDESGKDESGKDESGKDVTESKFSIEFLFMSGLISICISLLISYIIAGKDERILTDNYWDPVEYGSVINTSGTATTILPSDIH